MRLVLSVALGLMLPAAAFAYTVILKGGRQVEIPDNFVVTETTLTYEAAPSINVTIQMASIDIAATERANHEPPGSLMRRVEEQRRAALARTAGTHAENNSARRTVTNSDLAASRRAREESEARYEQRRRELGLPSLEEARRQDEEEARRASERAQDAEVRQARDEEYWRTRAAELRAQIAELDGQISYLYARLNDVPSAFSYPSYAVVSTIAPAFPFGRAPFRGGAGGIRPVGIGRPGVIATGPHVFGRVGFGGGSPRVPAIVAPHSAALGPRVIAGVQFGQPIRSRGIVTGFPVFPSVVVSAPYYDQNYYERDALLERIRELEAERAGLQARWRVLEDEARRAGAPPGWLR